VDSIDEPPDDGRRRRRRRRSKSKKRVTKKRSTGAASILSKLGRGVEDAVSFSFSFLKRGFSLSADHGSGEVYLQLS
jgi:hypothetical protein